jgi:hypothetical protein
MLIYQAFELIKINSVQIKKYGFTEFFGKFSAIQVTTNPKGGYNSFRVPGIF